MAVYTKVDVESAKAFVKQFAIGELTDWKEIVQGVENSNFALTTTSGRFIVTIYEKRVNPSDLPYFNELLNHLSAKNFQCPRPLKSNGSYTATLMGKAAGIVTFLEGSECEEINERHAYCAGKALAELHMALADFQMKRLNSMGLNDIYNIYQGFKSHLPYHGVTVNIIENAFKSLNIPASLPEGTIHADLFPDNVFFQNDKVSGVIDFYFSCTGFLAYDLAIAIVSWCMDALTGEVKQPHLDSMIAGYESARKLVDDEQQALPSLMRLAALRFLISRLNDAIYHDPQSIVNVKNPEEYLLKLRALS